MLDLDQSHTTDKIHASHQNQQIILRAHGVSKHVNTSDSELTILDNVSLSVQRGESLAIVGPSGAGKSTLLGLLAGLDTPTAGDIWMGDNEITSLDEEGRAGFCFFYISIA